MLPPHALLRDILSSGVQAPSAENKHYLRFEVLPNKVQLWTTDHGSWADLPHRQLLAMLSYGAVLENMALHSASLGHDMLVAVLPDAGQPQLVAELQWRQSDPPPGPHPREIEPLAAAIAHRHTHRGFYRRAPLPAQTLARLSEAAAGVAGAQLVWLDDPARRATALSAIRLAETERFRRPALHAEMFSAIRFELGWRATTDEGLPPAALQVEAPSRLPFALLRHWPVMRAATWLGAHVLLGLRAGYLPCALAPHLGMVVTPQAGPAGQLQAGRALQRVWLAATAQQLALQPFAAMPALMCQHASNGWVSPAAQQRLATLWGALQPGNGTRCCMLFRLGQTDTTPTVPGRKSIEHYIGKAKAPRSDTFRNP